MDWSPEAVLDYRARTHRPGLKWAQRRDLLWPVRAWHVVVPKVTERQLNALQRVVLRMMIAGCRQHVDVATLLSVEPELVAYVAQELIQMSLIDERCAPTARAARLLEDAELGAEDVKVGWVFQDTYSGRLFPRFVEALPLAKCESSEGGGPQIQAGSKGNPRTYRAFVVPDGGAPLVTPSTRDIMDAARRHGRSEMRHRRAGLELGTESAGVLRQISLLSEQPESVHLLTFAYVPAESDEELPWYIADPFGFGASSELRETLETVRGQASGTFRDMLDSITGSALDQHRANWLQMQTLLADEARIAAEAALPRGAFAGDEVVREALEKALLEQARLEHAAGARRIDARDLDSRDLDFAYLRLRQAVEVALGLAHQIYPPGDAWKKLAKFEKKGAPATGIKNDASRQVIRECARHVGFSADELPRAISGAKWGQVQWVCQTPASGRIRPTLAAFLLAAADNPNHPLREVAASHPRWLNDVDHIASAAGGQVHSATARRRDALSNDTKLCVSVLGTLMNALGRAQGAGRAHG